MHYSQYRFTLDLQKHQSQQTIAVFKHDTAVKLYISITDGGKPYIIEDGSYAIFYGKRADGEELIHSCTITESHTELIYEFEPTTTYVEGIVNCQCRLYGSNQKLITAPRFSIVVDERVVNDEDIDLGESNISALDDIFLNENKRLLNEYGGTDENGDTVIGRVNAEAQRVVNEDVRQSNEAERITNEDTRQENESVRTANEDTRQENESVRTANEDTRQENEVIRIGNEDERCVNENTRQESEAVRIANEDERIANEAERYAEELTRKDAESARELAEIDRNNRLSELESELMEEIGKFGEAIFDELDAHTTDTSAHNDIRDQVREVASNADSALTTHNTATTAHNDIRELLQANAEAIVLTGENLNSHNIDTNAHNDIRDQLQEFMGAVAAVLDSDEETLDQMSEIVDYIKSNRDLIDAITTSKVSVSDIVNELTSTATNKPLSANAGRSLNNNKVNVSDIVNNLTSTDTKKPLSANQGKVLNEKLNDYALKYPISDQWKHNYGMLFILMNTKNNGNYQYEKSYVTHTEAVSNGIPRRDGNGKVVAHDHVKNTSPSYFVSSKELASALEDFKAEFGTGGGSGGSGDCTCSEATSTSAGLMSAADKFKLDGIASGATKNTATATSTSAGLMSAADKKKLDGIQEGATAGGSGGSTYEEATEESAGLMSAADKKKLNEIEEGATKNFLFNATTTSSGLMSALDKQKLESLYSSNTVNYYHYCIGVFGTYVLHSIIGQLTFYMNTISKYKEDTSPSTMLAEILSREGMSFSGSGKFVVGTSDANTIAYDVVRLQVYNRAINIEVYDPDTKGFTWLNGISDLAVYCWGTPLL